MGEKESSVDPRITAQINREGWEGNAAVLVGKEGEEMKNLRERLETGGECADAATYVRLHKEIAVPADDVPDRIKTPGRGWLEGRQFRFIDKDGNLCQVDVDYKKIASVAPVPGPGQEGQREVASALFGKELSEHGFEIRNGWALDRKKHNSSDDGEKYDRYVIEYNIIFGLMEKRQAQLEQLARERQKKEFDF